MMTGTFSGMGTSISSMFSGIFSSIGSWNSISGIKSGVGIDWRRFGGGGLLLGCNNCRNNWLLMPQHCRCNWWSCAAGLSAGGVLASAGNFIGGMCGRGW
jgi:hypothetical protein